MEESIFMDGVRGVMAVIDRAVYGLISVFYDTILTLADTTIIGSDKISEITNKVYALIAIFMIFKISFSLINYLVNPDMIVDKAKGGGVLVKNIIITFILVITVPCAFDLLFSCSFSCRLSFIATSFSGVLLSSLTLSITSLSAFVIVLFTSSGNLSFWLITFCSFTSFSSISLLSLLIRFEFCFLLCSLVNFDFVLFDMLLIS